MSKVSDIRTLLINRITALSTVGQVYGYEEPHPKNYPVVFVTPADMDGAFVTNAENRRIYGFLVTVSFPTGSNLPKDASKTPLRHSEDVCNDVVDQIINDIDENFTLDGVTILFIEAADARWGFINVQGGSNRALQVTLRIHTDFNVT